VDELTEADLIWNRACEGNGADLRRGDRALRAMISAHGLVMNGGVLHVVECLSPSELSDAECGYRFFGLDSVAELLSRARLSEAEAKSGWVGGFVSRVRRLFGAEDGLSAQESRLDEEYHTLVPDDSFLVERFEGYWQLHPSDFVPL
jgi:hypothetical protein